MSHADANFRNSAIDQSYYLGFDPGRATVGVMEGNPSVPPFIPIECGTPVTGTLYSTGTHAVYRTSNIVTNQRYYSRVCTIRVDYPGPLLILVTATGFEPFITLVRSASQKWTGVNSAGGASISTDITEEEVGPFNLEVSSVGTYATGDFEVDVSCAGPSVPLVLAADPNPGCKYETITFTATATSSQGTPTGSVEFREGVTVKYTTDLDGSGVATWVATDLSLGTHSIKAFFTGTGDFEGMTSESLQVDEVVNCCYLDFSSVPSQLTTLSTQPVIDWWIAWIDTHNPSYPGGFPASGFETMTIAYQGADAVVWATPYSPSYYINVTLYADGTVTIDSGNGCWAQFAAGPTGPPCVWDELFKQINSTGGSSFCTGHAFPGGFIQLTN